MHAGTLELQPRRRRLPRQRGVERGLCRAVAIERRFELRLEARERRFVRGDARGAAGGVERLEHAPGGLERQRQLVPGGRVAVVDGQRLPRRRLGLVAAPEIELDAGEVGPHGGIARRALRRFLQRVGGSLRPRAGVQRKSEIGPGFGGARVDVDGRADPLDRVVRVAHLQQPHAEEMQRRGVPRIGVDQRLVAEHRLAQLAAAMQVDRGAQGGDRIAGGIGGGQGGHGGRQARKDRESSRRRPCRASARCLQRTPRRPGRR